MGNMSQFVSRITDPLDALLKNDQQLIQQYRESSDTIQRLVSLLLSGKQDGFVGAGASAFQAAMQDTSTALTAYVQALDNAVNAHHTCYTGVLQAAEMVDNAGVNQTLLQIVLERVNPLDVMDQGEAAVDPAIYAVGAWLVEQINAQESWFGHLVDGVAEIIQKILPTGELVGGDGLEYMGNLPHVLREWALALYDASMHWKIAIAQAQDVYHTHHTILDNTVPTNMSELVQMIDTQYGTKLPIGITMLANGTILVTLAGTEFDQSHQSNNGSTALKSGLGDVNNAYEQDVMNAINAYMLEHHLQPGTNVVIAGHSLGGMVAQEIASMNGSSNFHVSDVVTFGSPQMGPPVSGVNYQEYFARFDPVPNLSTYQAGRELMVGGAMTAIGGPGLALAGWYGLSPTLKEIYTGETYVPDIGGNLNPLTDHGSYKDPSAFLENQPVPFSIPIGSTAQSEYYGTTNQ